MFFKTFKFLGKLFRETDLNIKLQKAMSEKSLNCQMRRTK